MNPPRLRKLMLYFLTLGVQGDKTLGKSNVPACPPPTIDNSIFFTLPHSIASSAVLLRHIAQAEEQLLGIFQRRSSNLSSVTSNSDLQNCFSQLTYKYFAHYDATTGRLLSKFKRAAEVEPTRATNVAWNPLAGYHLLRRFNLILKPLYALIDGKSAEGSTLRASIDNTLSGIGWPTDEDTRLSARSILRIHHFYDLNTTDLANGRIAEEDTGVALSARDCNFLGEQAGFEGYHALAVEWFEEALRRLNSDDVLETLNPIRQRTVEDNLRLSMIQHDVGMGNDIFEKENGYYVEKLNRNSSKRTRARTALLRRRKFRVTTDLDYAVFAGLCAGENYQPWEEKSKLFCYLETKMHPIMILRPAKVEIVSLSPLLIIQYHDVLREKAMRMLEESEGLKAEPATVEAGYMLNIYELKEDERSAVHSFVDDENREDRQRVLKFIEEATGLNQASPTRSLEVSVYRTGGHLYLHPDSSGSMIVQNSEMHRRYGDTTASFVFYLSDVIKGGATAFPQVGVAVSPIPGSVAAWFNLRRSTESIEYNYHGGCPVIIGEKWIGLQLVHSNDQMFIPRFKCAPDQNETVGFTVNGVPITKFL